MSWWICDACGARWTARIQPSCCPTCDPIGAGRVVDDDQPMAGQPNGSDRFFEGGPQ
jgi:hypothetical protein